MLVFVTSPEIILSTDALRNNSRSLNTSIGIMLRSYTQALQKQEKFNGSLFQQHTKAVCLTDQTGIDPSYFNTAFGIKINITPIEKEYPQVCFDYIHNNPVKDGLVNSSDQWEFSSAMDYAGKRKGTLIDKDRATQFGLIYT
jgi:putative transposase